MQVIFNHTLQVHLMVCVGGLNGSMHLGLHLLGVRVTDEGFRPPKKSIDKPEGGDGRGQYLRDSVFDA